MQKGLVIVSLIVIGMFLLMYSVSVSYNLSFGLTGFAIYEDSGHIKEKIDVLKEFEDQENVKVIVKEREALLSVGKTGELDEVIQEIGEEKVVHELKSSEAISVEITKEDFEKIIDKNVDFEKEEIFSLHLTDVVEIVNSSSVNLIQESGENLTGLGKTACIIDTGINFEHQDLIGKNMTCNIDCVSQDCVEDCSVIDLNGHGTHVAGIVAANGKVKGIAPEANLIGVKIFPEGESSGATSSDLISGIDWCVENSEEYGISVITLSLGTSFVYESSCDGSFPTITDSINNAVDSGVIVTISSGNSGSTTGISAPACIDNAIAVGATDKLDNIASYTNRNSLVKLFAPGSSVNSSWVDGNYKVLSGTSMSAPVAAGSIVILQQYFGLIEESLDNKEIETLFFDNGKKITENQAEYSRINIHSTINSLLPEQELFLNVISPENNSASNKNIVNFTCNLSDDKALSSLGFYLENETGLVYSEEKNISGLENETGFEFSFEQQGEYFWYCVGENNLGENVTSGEYIFYYDNSSPFVSLIYPEENRVENSSLNISFLYSVNENESLIDNCSLVIDNTSVLSQYSGNGENEISYAFENGNYSWEIGCFDLAGNYYETSPLSLEIFVETQTETSRETPVVSSEESSGGSGGGGGGGATIKPKTIIEEEPVEVIQEEIEKPNESEITFDTTGEKTTTTRTTGQVINLQQYFKDEPGVFFVLGIVVLIIIFLIYKSVKRYKPEKTKVSKKNEKIKTETFSKR